MKKVLSLVLAAAMALGVTATAFAADPMKYTKDTTPVTLDVDVTIPDVSGNVAVSTLRDGNDVPATGGYLNYGSTQTLRYTVVAVANANVDAHVWNYEAEIKIKGPADVTSSRIDRETFSTWVGDDGLTYVAFDVTFKITPTNETATGYKGLVITYGAKVVNPPSRSNLKGKTDAKNTGWAVGYSNIDEDEFYNDVVKGYDDMKTYEEKSFEVAFESNPIIPSSAIKFLQKNLGNSESVIFVQNSDGDTVYFDSTKTLELTGSAIDKFPSNAHANVKVNSDAVDEIKDALDEAEVENLWFNYAVSRPEIEATHSLDSGYDDPHVYLVNEDGSLTEIEVKEYDYGDVAFTGPMTQYVITEGAIPAELFEDDTTDEPIEDDDLIDEPTEDDDNLVDEDGNKIENNPGTGSSNAISLAVAMAVVSLAAAGLVASKKASK